MNIITYEMLIFEKLCMNAIQRTYFGHNIICDTLKRYDHISLYNTIIGNIYYSGLAFYQYQKYSGRTLHSSYTLKTLDIMYTLKKIRLIFDVSPFISNGGLLLYLDLTNL